MFLAGFLTVAQFSFWGNYLPHVYPVHLRGTGESFAANIGGRLIGTCFFGITQFIATMLPIEGLPATRSRLCRGRRGVRRLPGQLHRQLLPAGAEDGRNDGVGREGRRKE